jgi:hypothetical protein
MLGVNDRLDGIHGLLQLPIGIDHPIIEFSPAAQFLAGSV